MRFKVGCFENAEAFAGERTPLFWRDDQASRDGFASAPLACIATYEVEADASEDACEAVYRIGNAPDFPTDLRGRRWPLARSMSCGDVALVDTPDGPVAYGCVGAGWLRLEALPAEIAADFDGFAALG